MGGGALVLLGDASTSTALSAHVESPPGLSVEFVTLSCSNQCADVLAVAKGGFEPYTYAWEDGILESARRVCPASTTNYRVSVTDAGLRSGEFKREPETVRAPLTANVLRCPDSGAVPPGSGGAGGSSAGTLCITNPSFEGTPAAIPGFGFDAPPWQACDGAP